MSYYSSSRRYGDPRGRKRNPNFKWKKSPTNAKQKSGKYDHENIEKEIKLNQEENKLNEDNSAVIKRGVYYHHDRKNVNANSNNTNNKTNKKEKENISINNNDTLTKTYDNEKRDLKKLKNRQLRMKKLSKNPYQNNQNGRRVYSNDVERNLKRKRNSKQIPAPYPPNYPKRSDYNYQQQPYIDSPNYRNRRRTTGSSSRSGYYGSQYQGSQDVRYRNMYPYNNTLPQTSAHALMQLHYEAKNAATTAQALFEQEYQQRNKYGTYLPDGSWYPYPEAQVRYTQDYYPSTKKTSKKSSKDTREKPSSGKYIDSKDDDLAGANLTPGQKVNRVQNQLEYYFSEENLASDKHLRSLLDSEGWVNAKNIENFPRMQKYKAKKDIIIEAAYHSNFIEVKDNKYIRMKVGWESFVGKKKDKDESKTQKKSEEKKEDIKKIDIKSIAKTIDDDKSVVSKKEIKNIVKSIQLKDKKYKERQKKKKQKKDDDKKPEKKKDKKDDTTKKSK